MKKSLVVLSMLIFLISCGKGKDNKNESNKGNNKVSTSTQTNTEADEIKRYNAYINIYNNLLNVDKNLRSYFEKAGGNETLNKSDKISIATIHQNLIDNLEKNLENAKNDELDNTGKAMLPVLKEMKAVTDEMKNYYDGKDYTSDNFAKGQELHKKLLEIVKKYEETSGNFKNAVKKKTEEQKEKDIAQMQKEGRIVAYNMMKYNMTAEKVLDEISKQKINVSNFTDADLTNFKELQKELIAISDELQKVATTEQLKKEGYGEAFFPSFKSEVNDFKATVATFIERVEKKDKSNDTVVNTSFFAETEKGTPENIYREFNELVNNYNNLIR